MAGRSSSVAFFHTALQSFVSSQSSLRILRTLASSNDISDVRPSQLLVLDSSFNPPSKAHLGMVSSAVMNNTSPELPKRLVLLLATQNADKPAQPASFEHRLCMMTSFAEDLLQLLKSSGNPARLAVDVGVTKLPFFVGKAASLASDETYAYGLNDGVPIQQTHLIGYDTLIRILDPKYYPPDHKLTSLAGLFQHHRLRVTKRVNASWGDDKNQNDYLEALRTGARESDGADRAWADHIDLVESANQEDNTVSSTKAREAAASGAVSIVRELCTESVAEYVISEKLYMERG